MIDLVHEQLQDDGTAPAREEAYFAGARIDDGELRDAAAQDEARRVQARARQAEATRSNLGLGHDIRAGLIQPSEAQLRAVRDIVCRLLVRHYRELIAYGAGWTDPGRGCHGRTDHPFWPMWAGGWGRRMCLLAAMGRTNNSSQPPEIKAVIVDQEAIKNAETRAMQSARDDAQRVLQAAERVQQTAEQNVEVMRTVAIVAVAGLVLVALVHAMRGKHH